MRGGGGGGGGFGGFQKLSHFWRVLKILLERGDNPEKGEGVDVEMGGGGCQFFITLQFNRIYCACGEKVCFIVF